MRQIAGVSSSSNELCDISSPEISTSSESISEEESVPQASRGKGKQNAKERKQQTPVSIIYPHIKKCYSYGRVRF